jgi:WD40 repeat protein
MAEMKIDEGDNTSKLCAGVVIVIIIVGSILVYFAFSNYANFWDFPLGSSDSSDLDRFKPSETDRADHDTQTPIEVISWSPNGSLLAVASMLDGFIIFETETWIKVYENDRKYLFPTSFDWTSDGELLALGSNQGVCIYKTKNWEPIEYLEYDIDIVRDLEFSPDDSKLATAIFEDEIQIWDCNDWKFIKNFKAHDDLINKIAWSPDGSMLASTSWDETAKIWDTSNWELKHEITRHSEWVAGVAWSPDGDMLATGSWDNSLIIWETLTWTEIQIIINDYSQNELVEWNYDGSYLVTNKFDDVFIYTTDSWTLVTTLTDHEYGTFAFDWVNGENRCASGSFKNLIKVWEYNEATNEFELEIEFKLEFEP